MAETLEHKQQKQYCNKFNKGFKKKNGPHQRKKDMPINRNTIHNNFKIPVKIVRFCIFLQIDKSFYWG